MQHDKDKESVTAASTNPRWWRENHVGVDAHQGSDAP